MKLVLFKDRVLIKQEDLDKALKDAEKRGAKKSAKEYKERVESLELGIERKTKETDKLKRALDDAIVTVNTLQEERDDVREVVKQKMNNDDQAALLDARKDGLDGREAKLKDRESRLGTEEDKRYKEGYADGVADGVRKINEITQKDRDNAMKVAMVSAASHTDPRIVAEINNVKSLTEGTTDSED